MTPSIIPVAASLAAIVILILALGYILRRLPGAGRGTSALRIRAALAVGARERVLWIEAAGKHLLIGVTANNVRTLHEFATEPLTPGSNAEGTAHRAAFTDILNRALGKAPQ